MWRRLLLVSRWYRHRAPVMSGLQATGPGADTNMRGCADTGSESGRATTGFPMPGHRPVRTGTTPPATGSTEASQANPALFTVSDIRSGTARIPRHRSAWFNLDRVE